MKKIILIFVLLQTVNYSMGQSKAGFCPQDLVLRAQAPFACTVDNECAGALKCCKRLSGDFVCVASVVSSNVNWNGNNWAIGCSFATADISIVASLSGDDCRSKCDANSDCTHFAWTKTGGGACSFKTGTITKDKAINKGDQTLICGISDKGVKPGYCPDDQTLSKLSAFKCTLDSHCSDDAKCCKRKNDFTCASPQKLCGAPVKDLNPCVNPIVAKYYYDFDKNQCVETLSCSKTDQNLYDSKTSCELSCVIKGCGLARYDGSCPCKEKKQKYYYDAKNNKCRPLKTCEAFSENTYDSKKECEGQCLNLCFLKPDAGLCTQTNINRFYFDQVTKKCKTFKYKGCFGNGNNFQTITDCESMCIPYPCNLDNPMLLAKCVGTVQRFFFNKETKKCETVMFGACGSTENNFLTKEECERVCLSVLL